MTTFTCVITVRLIHAERIFSDESSVVLISRVKYIVLFVPPKFASICLVCTYEQIEYVCQENSHQPMTLLTFLRTCIDFPEDLMLAVFMEISYLPFPAST